MGLDILARPLGITASFFFFFPISNFSQGEAVVQAEAYSPLEARLAEPQNTGKEKNHKKMGKSEMYSFSTDMMKTTFRIRIQKQSKISIITPRLSSIHNLIPAEVGRGLLLPLGSISKDKG